MISHGVRRKEKGKERDELEEGGEDLKKRKINIFLFYFYVIMYLIYLIKKYQIRFNNIKKWLSWHLTENE